MLSEKELRMWKVEAAEEQEEICAEMCDRDWEEYNYCRDSLFLKLKIGWAIFGPPKIEGDSLFSRPEEEHGDILSSLVTRPNSGYTDEQGELIDKIAEKLYDLGTRQLKVAFVLVLISPDCKQFPVFKFQDRRGHGHFMDASLRVYQNWEGYLCNNNLPECWMCFPKNGSYELERFKVEYSKSPACKTGARIVTAIDTASNVAGVGGLVACLGSLVFPPLAVPALVAGGMSGVWSASRAIHNLVDRNKHEQSIGLEDSEARGNWINIAGATTFAASGGATTAIKILAQRGRVVGTATRIGINVVTASSISVNGVSLINETFSLWKNRKNATATDYIQLAAAGFFFTHSVVNYKSAAKIIKQEQMNLLNNTELSKRQLKKFKKLKNNHYQNSPEFIKGASGIINVAKSQGRIPVVSTLPDVNWCAGTLGEAIANQASNRHMTCEMVEMTVKKEMKHFVYQRLITSKNLGKLVTFLKPLWKGEQPHQLDWLYNLVVVPVKKHLEELGLLEFLEDTLRFVSKVFAEVQCLFTQRPTLPEVIGIVWNIIQHLMDYLKKFGALNRPQTVAQVSSKVAGDAAAAPRSSVPPGQQQQHDAERAVLPVYYHRSAGAGGRPSGRQYASFLQGIFSGNPSPSSDFRVVEEAERPDVAQLLFRDPNVWGAEQVVVKTLKRESDYTYFQLQVVRGGETPDLSPPDPQKYLDRVWNVNGRHVKQSA